MYNKNLTEDFRLRLSKSDMDFLRDLSEKRGVSLSECLRSIIGEYRRSCEYLEVLGKALEHEHEERSAVHGDTKTDKHNKL